MEICISMIFYNPLLVSVIKSERYNQSHFPYTTYRDLYDIMMGRNHTSISVAWGFLIASPLLFYNPIYFVALLIGVVLGAVFPDIDAANYKPYDNNKPKKQKYDSYDDIDAEGSGGLMILMGLVSYPAMHLTGFLVSKFTPYTKEKLLRHRALMHSPLGIIISLLIIFVPVNIILYIIGLWHPAILIASFGVLLGAIFHLFEDSCTRTGINFIYPFRDMGAGRVNCIKGNVCTGGGRDNKAGVLFSQIFLYMGVFFIVYYAALRKLPQLAPYDFTNGMGVGGLLMITTLMSVVGLTIMIGLSKTGMFLPPEYKHRK